LLYFYQVLLRGKKDKRKQKKPERINTRHRTNVKQEYSLMFYLYIFEKKEIKNYIYIYTYKFVNNVGKRKRESN
jgi:hypothetical protein